ncbi:MAG: hypothetical protein J0M18_20325 [Ignavibacteria bacterium]|nr:hypothetical protein [Ignavibacteria bacterium]
MSTPYFNMLTINDNQSKNAVVVAPSNLTPSQFYNKADFQCNWSNDTAQIQAAIDFLRHSTEDLESINYSQGTVYLLPGYYNITGPITLYTSIEVVGMGMWETKLILRNSNACFTSDNFSSYVRLANITIDGGDPAGTGYGVTGAFKQSTFERIRMVNMKKSAFKFYPANFGDGLLNIIQYNDINVTGNNNDAFAMDFNEKNYDTWIINNNVGSVKPNLRISGGPFRILGNHFNGSTASADQPENNIVTELGLNSCVISNNIIENAKKDAIILKRVFNSDPGLTNNNINISNNLIRSENLDANGQYSMVKFINGGQNFKGVTFIGNLFEQRFKTGQPQNKYKNALELNYVENVVVSANVFALDNANFPLIGIGNNTEDIQILANAGYDFLNVVKNNFTVRGSRIEITDSDTIQSSTAGGFPGQIAWDENYLYVCISDSHWRRIPLPKEDWDPS